MCCFGILLQTLLNETVVANLSNIVGYDHFGKSLAVLKAEQQRDGSAADRGGSSQKSTHQVLVEQGHTWADHIRETWTIILIVSCYLIISVGLNLPIFGLLADAVIAIIKAGGAELSPGSLAFTPRSPHIMYQQSLAWTLCGLAVQMIDAVWYVYLAKNLTFMLRIFVGRPISARYGKRTVVIVDSPCVHQVSGWFFFSRTVRAVLLFAHALLYRLFSSNCSCSRTLFPSSFHSRTHL
jgi:hypothetical protein